jgi:putative heme-binding domain-containing protein
VQRAALIRSYSNYLLDPPLDLSPVLTYLTEHPTEEAVVRQAGLEVLAVAGLLKGDKAEKWLLDQLDDPDAGLHFALIKAVGEARLVKTAPTLVKWLKDKARPAKEREAVLKALRELKDPATLEALKEILGDKPTSPESAALQREAFRALANLDPTAAAAHAEAFLFHPNHDLQRDAVQALGASADGARKVGQLYLDKKLPRELMPQVTEVLRKHSEKDAEAAKLLAGVMKGALLVSTSPAEIEKLRKLVARQGDPMKGRTLYLNGKTLACINCHRLEGVGGQVGPDLTRLWDTHSVEKILEAILEPSKEIKEGYQTFVATTKKGVSYTGLKVSQSAEEVVLREATGRDVRIPTKDLDELNVSKTSLMPDNVVALLTYDQFIDLTAFLKDRQAQESLRGLAMDFWVVGPFGDELKTPHPPETKADPDATYPGDKKWQPAQAEPSGLLNLKAIFKRDHASAYALTYVWSPTRQKATMLLGSDDTVRVWLNATLVHEYATSRSARPDEDKVEVDLKEGWNVVLAKVVNLDGDHGLYLRFRGEGLRVSRTQSNDKLPGAAK